MERVLPSDFVSTAAEPASAELADFDAVVRVYQPQVYRFVLGCLREPGTAEDLTQECFLRAFKARHTFRGDCAVRTWLMRVAVNLVRSHVAGARFRFWMRLKTVAADSLADAHWVPDGHPSPEALALAKQQVAAVWNAASDLPPQQRAVFLLRFVEDMELLEIAQATGLAEGTVKTHLFRALQAVRRRIEETK